MKMIKIVVLAASMVALVTAAGCSPTPVSIKIEKEKYVLDSLDKTDKIVAQALDKDGNPITEGLDIVFFTENTKIIKLSGDGSIKPISSGEAKIDVEIVGTTLKVVVPVRVKLPSTINISHEKLRLWTGQVKENVWSEVQSEKEAFIEGFLPKWTSEDPSVVKVEQIVDEKRRQSWVKLTGMGSGDTFVITSFRHLSKSIRVRVYDEDEEVTLAGVRLGKKGENKEGEEEEKPKKKKKKKKKKKWKKVKKK